MRKYDSVSNKLVQVVCNSCGKTINVNNEVMLEEVLHVEKHWGFFSNQDGEAQKFDVCEQCYKKIISGFLIPVEKDELIELI